MATPSRWVAPSGSPAGSSGPGHWVGTGKPPPSPGPWGGSPSQEEGGMGSRTGCEARPASGRAREDRAPPVGTQHTPMGPRNADSEGTCRGQPQLQEARHLHRSPTPSDPLDSAPGLPPHHLQPKGGTRLRCWQPLRCPNWAPLPHYLQLRARCPVRLQVLPELRAISGLGPMGAWHPQASPNAQDPRPPSALTASTCWTETGQGA